MTTVFRCERDTKLCDEETDHVEVYNALSKTSCEINHLKDKNSRYLSYEGSDSEDFVNELDHDKFGPSETGTLFV